MTAIPTAIPVTAILTIGTDTDPEYFPRSILRAINNSKFKRIPSLQLVCKNNERGLKRNKLI